MNWLLAIADLPGFRFAAGVVLGIAVGMWLDHFLRRRESPSSNKPLTPEKVSARERAELKLFLKESQEPYELFKENVWRWFVFKQVGINLNGSRADLSTHIFVVFEHEVPTTYRRATTSKPGVRLNVIEHTARSAVVIAEGNLDGATVELIFSVHAV